MNNLVSDMPRVSVIVPVFNAGGIIGECLEGLLSQDYPRSHYEVFVVDNNSMDNTASVVRNYPVTYVEEKETQSSYAARNKAIRHSQGELLAFIDADCLATPTWLSHGVRSFEEAVVGCVAGSIRGFCPRNSVEQYLVDRNVLSQEITLRHKFLPYPQTANAFYRRAVFDRIGLFEERWKSGGDADLAWRMQLETQFVIRYVPEAVVFHQHRSTVRSLLAQRRTWGEGAVNLYKKYQRQMKKRSPRETLSDLMHLGALFLRFLKLLGKFGKSEFAKEKATAYLDLVSFFGTKVGMGLGSMRQRIFYV